MAQTPTVDARVILNLLAQKHAADVFIPECKDGPSQCTTHCRLDAWAMYKSWSNHCSLGYEIKVSRSDFLNDQKWPQYLAYCNEFYFVCPFQMIDPSEVGKDCGLIWMSKTGGRLFTKKKAPRREVEIPEAFYRYILMCRVEVTASNYYREDKAAAWRAWLENQTLDYDFGRRVGKAIREAIRKGIDEQKEQNEKLQRQIKGLEDIRKYLMERGIDPTKPYIGPADVDAAKEIKSVMRSLESMNTDAQRLYKVLADAKIRLSPHQSIYDPPLEISDLAVASAG